MITVNQGIRINEDNMTIDMNSYELRKLYATLSLVTQSDASKFPDANRAQAVVLVDAISKAFLK